MMTRTVVITLSAAAGYMALVIGLMVWCRYRRRKRKQAYLNENPEGILRKLFGGIESDSFIGLE